MKITWLERLRDRLRSVWDVLTGRAYAAYQLPDYSGELVLRVAMLQMLERDDRNGSLPKAYRDIINTALAPPVRGGDR